MVINASIFAEEIGSVGKWVSYKEGGKIRRWEQYVWPI
jgi:hypothetical protein